MRERLGKIDPRARTAVGLASRELWRSLAGCIISALPLVWTGSALAAAPYTRPQQGALLPPSAARGGKEQRVGEPGGFKPGEISTRSPAEQEAYYRQHLRAHPDDTDTLEALARAEAAQKNFPAAIAAYQRVLAIVPRDREARIQVARLLGWNREYGKSIQAFRAVLDETPDDREALDGLAHVQFWSGKLGDAAATYGRLAAGHPDDTGDLFEAARLEAETHQYPAARSRLTSLLALVPGNNDARLLLAQLELKQGQYQSSLRQFERVLERRPGDLQALQGAAQTRYYTGDLARAEAEAGEVVAKEPRNFDALFLLASIERARGRRAQARALLNRAERVSPHNPEVAELRERFWSESSTVLHLSAGYARELGSPAPGVSANLAEEDLRSFNFGSRLDFVVLPHSTSSLSFDALPVESPSGIIGGASAPSEFLYRQTTRLLRGITLRGGVGLEHFGAGTLVNFPQGYGLQPAATTAPVGFAGGSYTLNDHVSFDFTWSHLGIAYTPLAARLGVVSSRREGGASLTFDARTSARLTDYSEDLASEVYKHALSMGGTGSLPTAGPTASDRESGSGGTLTFDRQMLERERLALDLGWSALLFGYNGPRRNVYLGFFTPRFYQRELINPRIHGQFSRRLGYNLTAGLGVQQVGAGQALKRALLLSPALTFKITPYCSGKIGYTYYDSAQSLGIVRGDGVQLGIDWSF